jgi:hypothetical protein
MQLRIRDKMHSKLGKLDILLSYWEKTLGSIQQEAQKRKDKKMTDMCIKIVMVPRSIQIEIIKMFI